MENNITLTVDATAIVKALDIIARNTSRIAELLEAQDKIIKSIYCNNSSEDDANEDCDETEEEAPVDNIEKCLTDLLESLGNKNVKNEKSKDITVGDILAIIGTLI